MHLKIFLRLLLLPQVARGLVVVYKERYLIHSLSMGIFNLLVGHSLNQPRTDQTSKLRAWLLIPVFSSREAAFC